jgi:predicted amidohydrolase YtcJ
LFSSKNLPQGLLRLLVALLAVLCFAFAEAGAQEKVGAGAADTIIVHAKIYTLNAKQPWAEALAIKADKILAVGSDQDIQAYRGSSTKIVDAGGHLLLPGFEDCHIHFMDGSLGLVEVDLNGASSVAEIQRRVKAYAASHPKEPWITGMGWTYPTFGPAALPDKKILDEVVPDRPVYLVAFDGHSSWANSKALAMAGIGKQTPDPANGKIMRDAKGEATGALKESAGDLVAKVMPKPTREERLAALRKGIHEANKFGLTRVHSAGQDFEYLDLYDELRRKGELTLRFYVAYFLNPPELRAEDLNQIEQARRMYRDDWISGGVVKTMLDGVVEAHTAAMLTPYSDDPSQSGKLFWEPAKYKAAVTELDRRGLQVFTHAIGELAVRTALDAYEEAARTNQTKDARPRIEHIETISAEDVPRFGKLGVIASVQPLHLYPDEDTLDIWARNAGPERAQRAWSFHSIEEHGGRLAFGSDWPVVTLNPWTGMQTGITRKTAQGKPEGGFVPGEAVSLEDAIKAYTLGAAFAGRREKQEGSLEAGKLADLIIVNQDLFKIEPQEIGKTEVRLTMVGGKVVYESPEGKNMSNGGSAAPLEEK